MIPLSEVRVLDRNAEALGVPVSRLIENAGQALAGQVAAFAPGESVVVLAGPGNNGADGLAAARILAQQGAPVRVMTPIARGAWRSEGARGAANALPARVTVEHDARLEQVARACAEAGVIVDALLGAGQLDVPRPPYPEWIAILATHASKVVAVDVPTGFRTPITYRPARTITFHDEKEGMSEATCGRIVVAPIGIPEEASTHTGPGEYALYPAGRWDQHKGEGGIVLVIGGGPYTGAPAVAGLAALRAGADLAIVLTPQKAWSVVAGYSPNVVVRPLNGDDVNFEDPANRVTLNSWIKKARSIVLGPGLGLMAQAQRSVHHVLERAAKETVPVVVDADALTALSEKREFLTPNLVLTPHAKEFRTLTGKELPVEPAKRAQVAQEAVRELRGGAWLVKGPIDIITDGERVKLNATGDPAMSVGGTGDALAGVVGALLAKGLAPFDAARVGARLTGEAGEIAAAQKSWGLLATDVVDAIPTVLGRALPPRPRAPGPR